MLSLQVVQGPQPIQVYTDLFTVELFFVTNATFDVVILRTDSARFI